jgi:hypothetical protein
MRALMLFFLFATSVFAQDLPSKPQPQPIADHEYWIDVAAMGAGWTMDTISTHRVLSIPGAYEGGLLFPGSRSTAKVMGTWAAVDVGSAIVGYEWKRHVHNKWLHPFWRAFLLVPAKEHTRSAIHNWRQKEY